MFNKKPLADNTRRPSTGAQAKIYSRDNVARYSERARQRRRGRTVRRVALIAVLGVLLSATTAAGLWFATIMGKLGDSNVITNNLRQILVDTDEAKDPFYVLLLGTDGRPGEDTYRADSIILARIDPTQKQATLISVPRDTKVVYKGETMKINACHTVGGAEAMVQAVNELCGVQISHYAEVSFDGFTPQPAPYGLEAGTPNVAGVIGLSAALEWLAQSDIGQAENWSRSLASLAEEELAKRPGFRSFRCQQSSLLAFEFEGIHHSDLVTLLAESGIALRAGQHCAQPLLAALGVSGTLRASFAPYNTQDDVAALVHAVDRALEILVD